MTARARKASRGARRQSAHRNGRRFKLTAAIAATAITAGLVTATVAEPVPVAPSRIEVDHAGVTVGVGPLHDGIGAVIPWFFLWSTVPPGDRYIPIIYPANIFSLNLPLDLPALARLPYIPVPFDTSISSGSQALREVLAAQPAGSDTSVVGMSLGAIVVDRVRVGLEKSEASPDLDFLLIGNPMRPDGGILTRFGHFTIPPLGITFGRDEVDGDFPTTDITYQYDFIADFPHYGNPLTLVNALTGMVFTHTFPGYLFEYPDHPDAVRTTVGNTTYVTLPADLPLLFPLKVAATLVGLGHVVKALDTVLRVFVDIGYDRGGDPSVVREFEFMTPQHKFDEAWEKLPAALEQARRILFGIKEEPQDATGRAALPADARVAVGLENTISDESASAPLLDVDSADTVERAADEATNYEDVNHETANHQAAKRDQTKAGTSDKNTSDSVRRPTRGSDSPATDGKRHKVKRDSDSDSSTGSDRSASESSAS